MIGRLLGLCLIVRRSLRRHLLSTVVTVFSAALACGLVMAVFSVSDQAEDAFAGGPVGFDAVLGARGSALQLVLNTVFHLETSPGNLSWELYRNIADDPRVKLAVPYAVGDNYHGYRIVGTSVEMYTKFEYQEGKRFEVRPGGVWFDPKRREAVVGSVVADRLGLQLGAIITPYHGFIFDESKRHPEEYVVVGILKPTNSPSDRVIWIPIEGIFRMAGHTLRGQGTDYKPQPGVEIPDAHKEVSAVMLKFHHPQAGFALSRRVNHQGTLATMAWPIGQVMAGLFSKLGWVYRVLELVAYLVVVVAAGSILASIYNAMNERRREFAVLRALGARKKTVFSVIVFEAGTIAALGALAGYVVYFGILWVAAQLVRQETGVVLDLWYPHLALVWVPLGMVALGLFSGLLPAWKAYATDVARNLTN